MGTDQFGYLLIAIAGIASYIAFRSSFQLFKLGASVLWIAVFMWLKDYSPAGTEGDPFQVVAMLGAVVMVAAFMLAQLGREINRGSDNVGNFNVSSSGFGFKIPDWLKSPMGESGEQVSKRRSQETEEYRDRLHRALHPPKRETRGRRS